MELLTVVVIVGVLYVAYINRDRIKAAFNKDDDEKPAVAEPIVGPPATPNPGTIAPIQSAIAPNGGAYNGVGDPPSQEAWTAWLATLDPMTRRVSSSTT